MEENSLLAMLKSLDTPSPSLSTLNSDSISLITRMAFQWPSTHCFPALDLLRLVLLHSALPIQNPPSPHLNLVEALLFTSGFSKGSSSSTSSLPKEIMINAMLSFRGLSNLFETKNGSLVVWEQRNSILEFLINSSMESYSKGFRLSVSTSLVK